MRSEYDQLLLLCIIANELRVALHHIDEQRPLLALLTLLVAEKYHKTTAEKGE